ncbi:hypothetical protein Vadar_002269 [Vaccinium darrowii]|uniref:Uncharacterized protein n=1 Tax=Vaccinium darrowii TaxID=229202 RepID=A0ACB7WWV0_9ERIC|nr:hypothetical protein Vadar_002269 [Vaccinium darrowii]
MRAKAPRSSMISKGKISGEEGWISLGPWGGKDGEYWDFKVDGPMMQITVRYGDIIDSILFESKSSDGLVIGSSKKIGGPGGHMTETFCIESSVEQLSSIDLIYGKYNGQVTIFSLCFNTNRTKYGPFGSSLSYESIPIEGGVITGFHGLVGKFITAIGIFVTPKVNSLSSSEEKVHKLHSIPDPDSVPTQLKGKISGEEGWISSGPWGGRDGEYWAFKVEGPIIQITVRYGDVIDSILFESMSSDGLVIGRSKKIGGHGGHMTKTFCIKSSVEQLLSIDLIYGNYSGQVAIMSLCFNTNLTKYGPIGSNWSNSFETIPIEGGFIAGFHGLVENIITAIGIFVTPEVNRLSSSEEKAQSLHSIQGPDSAPTQLEGKISGEEGWICLGPWGGRDGKYWAYKVDGPIMQITVSRGTVINSILFESKRSDGLVIGSSKKIGGPGGHITETFSIDGSVEQLLSIDLTYGYHFGQVTIISLCFNTNLTKYGPFGSTWDASFESIRIEGGVVVGFHGLVGNFITAIGIFVTPNSIQDLDSAPTQGKISGEKGWISLGPWGGRDCEYWAYKVDGPIMQITVRHGTVIDSILFESKSSDGLVIRSSKKIGGPGGPKFETFCIDSSVEQLSSIHLIHGFYKGQVTIFSIEFNTNVTTYGPVGKRLLGGSLVSIPIEGGVIAGFHGLAGTFLTAFGIFVTPKVNSAPSSEEKVHNLHSIEDLDSVPTKLKGKISCEEGWISLGPWGGEDGSYWAYKAEGPIMQITICFGDAINSILFESKSSDGLVIGSSEKIGGSGGHITETVRP